MGCKYCNTKNLEYFKRVHQGKKQTQFHYLCKCLDCKKTPYVPRTKFVYEKVKDKQWTYKKNQIEKKEKS